MLERDLGDWARAREEHLKCTPPAKAAFSSVGLMWRDCAVVQTPVFAPVQETERWQASRYWLVLSGVAGGASDRSRQLWLQPSGPVREGETWRVRPTGRPVWSTACGGVFGLLP